MSAKSAGALVVAASLAACASSAPPLTPADTSAVIEIEWENAWEVRKTQLFPDDVMLRRIRDRIVPELAHGRDERRAKQLRSGAFERAREIMLSQTLPSEPIVPQGECSDYGGTRVRYISPDAEFVYSDRTCSDPRIEKLTGEIFDIVENHDPEARKD